jgi:hypothetical protein
MMFIETSKEKIEIKARVTEGIMPYVISIPFGWEEANSNVLTDWQVYSARYRLPRLSERGGKMQVENKIGATKGA